MACPTVGVVDPVITVAVTVSSDDAVDMGFVSDRTAVTPTRMWTKGEPNVLRNGHVMPRPWAYSGWRLELGPRRTIDLPGMLDELLVSVEPSGLHDLASEAHLEIVVSAHVYMADQAPVGTFEADLVRRIAAMGAVLDIDLYAVEDDYAIARLPATSET